MSEASLKSLARSIIAVLIIGLIGWAVVVQYFESQIEAFAENTGAQQSKRAIDAPVPTVEVQQLIAAVRDQLHTDITSWQEFTSNLKTVNRSAIFAWGQKVYRVEFASESKQPKDFQVVYFPGHNYLHVENDGDYSLLGGEMIPIYFLK